MKTMEEVRHQLHTGGFDFSRHALRRAVERNVSEEEIRQAGLLWATIIESYRGDKYSPSCLLLGFTTSGRPLHVQVSLANTQRVRIITLYEPDPNEWIDYSGRR